LDGLTSAELATVAFHVDRLAERGSTLRMPYSRSLGEGLFELRFDVGRVARRITFFFPSAGRIVLLTGVSQATFERADRSGQSPDRDGPLHRAVAHGRRVREMSVPTSWQDLKTKRLDAMNETERAEYDRAYAAAKLAAEVGERVRHAREAAGISQRELARRMGTSQSAVDRLEAGGVGATLTTLQRVASALGLTVSVDLKESA
jgi:DNA-binding XRE family transcriptional regulator